MRSNAARLTSQRLGRIVMLAIWLQSHAISAKWK